LPTEFHRTTVIHSIEDTSEDVFERLKHGCLSGALTQKDIIDTLFNVVGLPIASNGALSAISTISVQLVGGPFDLESRFIIESSENVDRMLELVDVCPEQIQVCHVRKVE